VVVAIETSVGVEDEEEEEEDGEKHIIIDFLPFGVLEFWVVAGRGGKSKWRVSFDVVIDESSSRR
jgi:hypothetical protein